MGTKQRAETESEKLGMSKTTKSFIKFLLGKCGNCPFRIVCWSQLFDDIGEVINAYKKVFECDGTYTGNAKASFDGKQVVRFIKNCAPCQYIMPCMCKILDSDEFTGMVEATSDDVRLHAVAIKRCANCKDNERCWSGILKDLGFGWHSSPKIAKIMIQCKFKKKGDCDITEHIFDAKPLKLNTMTIVDENDEVLVTGFNPMKKEME